jgi:hypothetical protein
MTVKKYYKVGDTVWIYGINRSNVKSVQGTVIKTVDLSGAGYTYEHYVVEIPSHIEPLLEIRTWHNISQDETGPVGSLRNLGSIESTIKFASTVGFAFDDNPVLDSDVEDDKISPDEIHAALEKSQKDGEHGPLVTKAATRKRQYFKKKKS